MERREKLPQDSCRPASAWFDRHRHDGMNGARRRVMALRLITAWARLPNAYERLSIARSAAYTPPSRPSTPGTLSAASQSRYPADGSLFCSTQRSAASTSASSAALNPGTFEPTAVPLIRVSSECACACTQFNPRRTLEVNFCGLSSVISVLALSVVRGSEAPIDSYSVESRRWHRIVQANTHAHRWQLRAAADGIHWSK